MCFSIRLDLCVVKLLGRLKVQRSLLVRIAL
jgi:hypothetical protein